jgi:DeoR/GlpR family transcriptional regulator of sugar metabolism
MTLPEHRRSLIIKAVEDRGSVTVLDLADRLQVSMMTIRRDLVELEREGAIRRVHGGAVSARGRAYEPLFHLRAAVMPEAKTQIGRLAAELAVDGDSIALDVGTTTVEVARALLGKRNLTIVTPSLHIANLFLNHADTRLIVTGGIARAVEGSLIGELTAYAFRQLHVDRLFLGVACLDAAVGMTEFNWEDAIVKQQMIASAKEVIVVADSAKFDKVAFAHVADFGQVHRLVTDQVPPQPLLAALKQAGVSVHVVGNVDIFA